MRVSAKLRMNAMVTECVHAARPAPLAHAAFAAPALACFLSLHTPLPPPRPCSSRHWVEWKRGWGCREERQYQSQADLLYQSWDQSQTDLLFLSLSPPPTLIARTHTHARACWCTMTYYRWQSRRSSTAALVCRRK